MSFANIRTNADLASRRSEAARLLQVAIDNEVWMEGKMKKFQDPRKIEEVPPQYKTYSELVADNIQQEQLVIKNLAELKIPFDMASQIAQYLSSQVEGGLVKFNASFPTIKADIMKKYNVKLLDQEFIKNYLNRFFNHLESSYGFTIDRDTGRSNNIFSSVAEAKAIIPTTDGVGGEAGVLQTLAGLVQTAIRIIGQGAGSELPQLIVKVGRAMPTQAELNLINEVNQITKKSILRMLSSSFNITRCPTSADIVKMNKQLLAGTGQAQLVVGIDEVSQLGRDTYSSTLGAMLNQIELQFRGCSDQSLAVMTGVREAIRKGEAVVELERLGQIAGDKVQDILGTQQMARELLGDMISQAVGFKEQEEENVRMIVEEEKLADDVVDKEVGVFEKRFQVYMSEVMSIAPDQAESATTDGGFNGILGDIYRKTATGRNYYTIRFIDAVEDLEQLFNRTGRSMDDFVQIVYNRSLRQAERQAEEEQYYIDNGIRLERGGQSNPIGRRALEGRDVGGMPPDLSDFAGGGRAGEARARNEVVNLVSFEVWASIHPELASKYGEDSYAIQQLSNKVGGYGVFPNGEVELTLPVNMTPELRRALKDFQKADDDYKAEQQRRANEAPLSADQQAEADAYQIRQQAEADARQSSRAQKEGDRIKVMEFINARTPNTATLRELVSRVNTDLGRYGLRKIEDKKQKQPLALIEEIAYKIVELTEAGATTILSSGRPVYDLSSKGVNFGVGMKRIPIKRKIGGGIAVQSTPTYAEFGKYAIHLPQLHNKNTLNIKYKSLGSIPTLKPITISDDFKDFILETLEKKSVNERALKKLPNHEVSYFERAVAGAGLLETFKMKRSNTDEEKKDLDRFNILRGELIAGNNSDKLVKELRSLIVKFLNTGRIHKAEGMNLLQELSVF